MRLTSRDVVVAGPPCGSDGAYTSLLDRALSVGATVVAAPLEQVTAAVQAYKGTAAIVPRGTDVPVLPARRIFTLASARPDSDWAVAPARRRQPARRRYPPPPRAPGSAAAPRRGRGITARPRTPAPGLGGSPAMRLTSRGVRGGRNRHLHGPGGAAHRAAYTGPARRRRRPASAAPLGADPDGQRGPSGGAAAIAALAAPTSPGARRGAHLTDV